jgi:peptidoglycan pentaglycine glycine transferase (the first glycine)
MVGNELMMTISPSDQEWDTFLASFPKAHLLQTCAWGQFKAQFGWSSAHIMSDDCGAQVLFRRLPLGYTIAYIPKGPVGRHWEQLFPELDTVCLQNKAIMLIIEPDCWEPSSEVDIFSRLDGFLTEEHTIQPRRTILVNLVPDEAQILADMRQKTRYNIRLAEKKGILVSESHDIEAFYAMMQTTGERDGFAVHQMRYYEEVYATFSPLGQCILLEATFEEQPVAALMAFACGERAWYFYGASTDQERQRMPTYLLQWEAMRWAKAKGCTTYDLWGVPDFDEATLEAHFTEHNDGLWGVYRFKRGFGGRLLRSTPALVKVYRPLLYRLYRLLTRQRPSAQPQA